MFLVYFDETGDPGGGLGSTPYFSVTALIIHETEWESLFNKLKELRQLLRDIHLIPLTLELKGHNIINANPRFKRINGSSLGRLVKPERLEILRKIICFISALAPLLEVQNVCFRKKHKIPLNKKDAKNQAKERFIRT